MNEGEIQHMHRQPRWQIKGILPIVTGIVWLVCGWGSGVVAGVLATPPGVLLIGAGASMLIRAGDRVINHWLALSAVASIPVAVILIWALGPVQTLLLIAGGVACAVLGGHMALWQDAVPAAVPAPETSWAMAFKATLDEVVIGFFLACSSIPRGDTAVQDRSELADLQGSLATHGGFTDPEELLGVPPAPEQVTCERMSDHDHAFDRICFDSGYAPPGDLPGADRWNRYAANRRMYARVLRHDDEPRPWLMCIHGYRMGVPALDFSLFDVDHLHRELGLNLIMPILPLHGARSVSRLSGGEYLDGPMTNLYHAEAQALWDLRRCLAWLRKAHCADRIGLLGYSLGGYNAALLAAFEPHLDCVIAGIPMTDIAQTLWRHIPTLDLRYIEACGLHRDWASELMAPLSPLHSTPKVPHNRRYIVAATGDQLIPPEQPLALWRHWGEPAMHWYHGSHLSVRRERSVHDFLDLALHESGMTASDHEAVASRP